MACSAACSFWTFSAVARLMANLQVPRRVLRCLELRPLSSTGVTRRQRSYGPLRHPKRPDLALAGCRLAGTRHHRWGFPCCAWSPVALMPPSLPRRDRQVRVARPSVYLRHVGSRGTLFEACSTFTRVAAWVLAESLIRSFPRSASTYVVASVRRSGDYRLKRPVAGRDSHPLKTSAFFTAH